MTRLRLWGRVPEVLNRVRCLPVDTYLYGATYLAFHRKEEGKGSNILSIK